MGDFYPLHRYCNDIAQTETREVTVSVSLSPKALPPGKYLLFESYCGDNDCDCRKVMINVVSKELKKIVATVGFGWENKEFYTNWMHGDAEIGKKLAGAYLELGCIQSQYSDACLELLKSIMANDHKYRHN